MGEFFKGWRRKFGLVTLLTACALMMVWVRNYVIRDSINVPTGNSSSLQLISGYHCLNIVAMWSSIPDKEMASFRIYRHEQKEGVGIHAGEYMLAGSPSPFRPKWPRFGDGSRFTTLMIFSLPYWSIVVPLTLVSLWLLISRPRSSTSKKIVEPISIEGV